MNALGMSSRMQAHLYDYDNVTVLMVAGLISPRRSFEAAMVVVRDLVEWMPSEAGNE